MVNSVDIFMLVMSIVFFLPYRTLPFSTETNNFNTFDIVCLSAYFFSVHLITTYCLVYRSDINNEVILHPYLPAHWHYTSLAHTKHTFSRVLCTPSHKYTHIVIHMMYTHKETQARTHWLTALIWLNIQLLISRSRFDIRWGRERGWFSIWECDWSTKCWHYYDTRGGNAFNDSTPKWFIVPSNINKTKIICFFFVIFFYCIVFGNNFFVD